MLSVYRVLLIDIPNPSPLAPFHMNPLPDNAEPHQCVLDKQIVLSLNKSWQALGILTARKAIVALCSESNSEKPAMALDIEMDVDENGNDILVNARPVTWEEWITLPIRPGDMTILTHRYAIRAPTVIICSNYNKMPLKRPRLCARAIWERDNGTCQYSGRKLAKGQGNLDHVIPRDRGGRDEWTNVVLSDKEINSAKGNRLNHEAGLKLIRTPKAPAAIPMSATITEARHQTWQFFLLK